MPTSSNGKASLNPNLSNGRFYVQYSLRPRSQSVITALQAELGKVIDGRPVAELHMTVIHFGIYRQVWQELQHFQPSANEPVFQTALAGFIKEAAANMVKYAEIKPKQLAWYGRQARTLVLEAEPTPALQRTHQLCLAALQRCLQAALGQDPLPFMQASPNFRYALNLAPHITLFKAAHGMPVGEPRLPEQIRLIADAVEASN